eukprot:222824_1
MSGSKESDHESKAEKSSIQSKQHSISLDQSSTTQSKSSSGDQDEDYKITVSEIKFTDGGFAIPAPPTKIRKQKKIARRRRKKVPLAPGHSQMHWMSKLNSTNPSEYRRRNRITKEELSKHCSRTDAWLSVNGQVFDVTDYVEFHPGGPKEILSGVGKDATALFLEVHPWVNPTVLLKNFYVGQLTF